MKIALCLHGLFDSIQDLTSNGIDGFDYINRNILMNNDVDVFIHSWSVDKKDLINSLYKPRLAIYQSQLNFSHIISKQKLKDFTKIQRKNPHAILSQFYSIQRSFELLSSMNKHYDIVIKARFDTGRINRLNSSCPYAVMCINLNKMLDMNFLYMAEWPYLNEGPADIWYYSNYDNMMNFTTLYNDLYNDLYLDSDFHKYTYNFSKSYNELCNVALYYKYWFEKNNLWDKKRLLKCTFN